MPGRIIIALSLGLVCTLPALAQDPSRFQQRVEYTMEAHLDVKTHKVNGTQKLVYFNNSRDTLTKVYYHLYFNAFQPGSMMDVRSRSIMDPDPRVGDRISKLKDEEIGYQHIQSLKQDGKDASWVVDGTILEVTLPKPILPNSKTTFDMKFESQVPIQIRRSGRNSKEGIAYSMTQWYPKMAEYDFEGWHAYQYVAREFHSVWGDFDVTLTLDPSYVVAATGKLINADKVGYGYEKEGAKIQRPSGELAWHFQAKNVIDFAWAADPDYAHEQKQVPDGPMLHFFYQPGDKTTENWRKMEDYAVKHFAFMNKTFGKYPYESYSIIQGGDGGMEYPMCTLITGERNFGSLTGVMAHEASHSWYQAVLASNEALHPWMDEGFTDYSSNESMGAMFNEANPQEDSYMAYFALVRSGLQEPADQHSDHFNTNRSYGTVAYSMGAMVLHQLRYVVGDEVFFKGMRTYFNTWKFKHPTPNDFIRVMEKTSGLELKWFLSYWIGTTKKIDYSIRSVVDNQGATFITLDRIGDFPMPIELMVTLKNGTKELHYIALNETLGVKSIEDKTIQRIDDAEWPWVNPSYTLKVNHPSSDIATIEIDPSGRLADVDHKNNIIDLTQLKAYEPVTK